MLSQSHSVNTSIELLCNSFDCDKRNRSRNQKKIHSVNESLKESVHTV